MERQANRIVEKLSFGSWLNVYHNMVKRQYRDLGLYDKLQLDVGYEKYLSE